MNEIKKGTGIQSLQVGFSIVDLIARNGQPMKFTDICEYTRITKSNLYKYLYTLTQLGILYRDKASGTYSIGSKLIEYGMAGVGQENVVERVTPHLQEINLECKETVLLVLWTHNGPMVVKILNSNNVVNIGAQMGSYLPLLSASGKTFAAFMDEIQMREWKEKEKRKLSVKGHNLLEKELTEIRNQRIAFARGPLVPSVSSVALPIFNYDQQLLGVITMVGFDDSIPQQLHDETSQFLLKKGQEVSQSFGAYIPEGQL